MSRVAKGTEYLDSESIRRIFDRMNRLGIKRVELARSLGFSNGSYMTRLEKGELRIQKSQVEKWAVALSTTPDYILGNTDEANDIQYANKKDRQMQKFLVYRKNMTEEEFKLWMKIGQDIVNVRKG